MKKFIIFSFLALTMSLFCASCVHRGDLEIETVPKIDFSLEKVDGYTYTLTNITKDATNVKWAILSFTNGPKTVVCEGSGDSFTFTFPAIGKYWIEMTATRNGREETIHTQKLIDKASCVKLDDDSFDDWDGVTNEKFMMKGRWISTPESEREGKNAFVDAKFDYDGDYVYFFVRVNVGYTSSPMCHMDGGDDGNEFIMFINADGDLTTTGPTQGDEGYEHGAEFGFWNGDGWAGFINTATGWDSVSDGEQAKLGPSFVYGTTKEDTENGYWCFEFGINRSIIGATNSAFGCVFQITSDWDTCDYLLDAEGNTDMIFQLVSE